MSDKKQKITLSDETIKNTIKSLLSVFQEEILNSAIEKGRIPKEILSMSKDEIINWYYDYSNKDEEVESSVLSILENNHGMNAYEAVIVINKEDIKDYLSSIISKKLGNACCVDKASVVLNDLIKSYSGKTTQYKRNYGHPTITNKRIWKKIIETCPIVTLSRPFEHSEAILEFAKLCDYIEQEKEKFLYDFYQEFLKNPNVLREGDAYQLAKDLNFKDYIFPMRSEENANALIITNILTRDSFAKVKKNPWYLYQYIQKNCPSGVRKIKKNIREKKLLRKQDKDSVIKYNLEDFLATLSILLRKSSLSQNELDHGDMND